MFPLSNILALVPARIHSMHPHAMRSHFLLIAMISLSTGCATHAGADG